MTHKPQSPDEKVIDYQYIRNLKNKEVRKNRFKRTFSQSVFRFLMVLVLLMEMGYLSYQGFRILRNSAVFDLRDVQITGANKSNPDEIRNAVVESGENTLRVDLTKIKLHLESKPWIQNAILWRELPGTIRIHLTERKPVAIVSAGNLYLVDNGGRVIQTLDRSSEYANLPVITGISEIDNDAQIREGLDFVQAAAEDQNLFSTISEFHYYDKRSTIIYLKGYPFGLLVSKDGILPMIRKFAEFSDFMKLQFSDQKLIDLRYEGQIIVKDAYREQL